MWGKKQLDSDEYLKLTNKITELGAKYEEIKIKLEVLETNYNDLRGKFNRKLGILAREEMGEDKTKVLNNPFPKFM